MSTNVKDFDARVEGIEGTKITYPTILGIPTTICHLQEAHQDLMAPYTPMESFPGVFPTEGAVALMKVLKTKFGMTAAQAERNAVTGELEPPTLLSVPTGHSSLDRVQIPWGQITVPGFTAHGYLKPNISITPNGPAFRVTGELRKQDQPIFQEIMGLVHKELDENSIYRGKAVQVDFKYIWDEDVRFDFEGHAPQFLDVSTINRNSLIFEKSTGFEIDRSIFTPIAHTKACRVEGVPLKRGVLLAGGFGCGKTLTTRAVANHCEAEGWTFMLCKDIRDLSCALRMAKRFQPCVVFAEDIDRTMAGTSNADRDTKTDEVLNVLDGLSGKTHEIMTILTTNREEAILPALLRPGRIDAIIPVLPPDAAAANRLVLMYAGKSLAKDVDWDLVGSALDGLTPATIREVVERSKLAAIGRGHSGSLLGHPVLKISTKDLIGSAAGMKGHIALCTEKPVEKRSERVKAAEIIAQAPAMQSPLPIEAKTLAASADQAALDGNTVQEISDTNDKPLDQRVRANEAGSGV